MITWLIPFFKRYCILLFIVFCLALISTALELSYPYLSKVFIDDVLIEQTYSLKFILLLTFSLMVIGILLQIGNSFLYLYITLNIMKQIRLYVFNHLQRLTYRFFLQTRVGDLTTRLNGDINIVQNMLTDGVLNFLMSIITFIIITSVLIYLDVTLFLLTLFIFPLLTFTLIYFRPIITRMTKNIREKNSDIQAHMIDSFSQIRLIKLLVAEKIQHERLDVEIEQLNKKTLRYAIVESFASNIPRIVTFGMTAIILFIGGMMVLANELTIGSLLAFTTYLSRYFSPVQSIANLYIRFHAMLVSLRRLTEFLHEDKEFYGQYAEEQLRDQQTTIQLDGMSYTFKSRSLFSNVTYTFHSGKAYALIGDSGSGKSTLLDMFVHLRKPSSGTVLFNDVPLQYIPVNALRKEVFVIPQEVELIHDTVIENLLFHLDESERKHILETQIECICKKVQLHEEIMNLPNGYETILGERGRMLSGGQKQRLSIARGLLQNPKILVLDEATSGLDYTLEKHLFKELNRWLKSDPSRMLLIVSHRIHALDWVDEVLQIQNGQLERAKVTQFI